ncbi:MAG: hypothetical protein PHQ81_02710 [Methanofollis sp.]|nr:hypothetical protein [Methanofollis sp.]
MKQKRVPACEVKNYSGIFSLGNYGAGESLTNAWCVRDPLAFPHTRARVRLPQTPRVKKVGHLEDAMDDHEMDVVVLDFIPV